MTYLQRIKHNIINLDRFVGLVAPHQCILCASEGAVLCDSCMLSAGEPPAPRCAGCKKLSDNWHTCASCRSWLPIYAVYVATAYEGVYAHLIHAFKFDIRRQAATPMAKMMRAVITEDNSEMVVCPVPTSAGRVRERGFDHCKLLAREFVFVACKGFAFEYTELLRRKGSHRQLGATRQQRMHQMESAFEAKASVSGKTVLLVDDVMTTGATLAAAARTLREAGAKRVYAIVFAQKV